MSVTRLIKVKIDGKVRLAKAKFPSSLFSKSRDKKGERKVLKSKKAEYKHLRSKRISKRKYKLCKEGRQGCAVKGGK